MTKGKNFVIVNKVNFVHFSPMLQNISRLMETERVNIDNLNLLLILFIIEYAFFILVLILEGNQMDFSFSLEKIIKVVKRFFLLIIVFAVAFYALGYYITLKKTNVSYYSYTDLYIHTTSSSVEDYVKYMDSEARYVDTYLLTIDTYKFYEELRQQLPEKWRDKVSAGYLKGAVSPSIREESAIVRFSVYTNDPDLSKTIATTLSLYMDDYLFNNFRVNSVQVVESPRPPIPSVTQNRYFSIILAVVGILAGFSIGYIKEINDIRIRTVADIERYKIPVLGVVPAFSSSPVKKGKKYAYGGYDTYSNASAKLEAADKKNKK